MMNKKEDYMLFVLLFTLEILLYIILSVIFNDVNKRIFYTYIIYRVQKRWWSKIRGMVG